MYLRPDMCMQGLIRDLSEAGFRVLLLWVVSSRDARFHGVSRSMRQHHPMVCSTRTVMTMSIRNQDLSRHCIFLLNCCNLARRNILTESGNIGFQHSRRQDRLPNGKNLLLYIRSPFSDN